MIGFFQAKPAPPPDSGPRDAVREVCETVVFVVALVLLLKLFVVEAFVIPTGSMAETLYGYQKRVTCPECGHDFPVNASDEVEPQDGRPKPLLAATCPNCRHRVEFTRQYNPGVHDGDRVLVHKALYALGVGPKRGDVVVFKFPVAPQTNHSATNYIKRLWGLSGETVAIYRGDLYVHPNLEYPPGARDDSGELLHPRPAAGREQHGWEGASPGQGQPGFAGDGVDYTYSNAEVAVKAFEQARKDNFPPGGFRLVRKSAELSLEMRRLVYDNDHQSKTLSKRGVPPRWSSTGWSANDPAAPAVFTHTGDEAHTLEYAHRVGAPPSDLLDANGTPVLQGGAAVRLSDWDRVTRPGGSWTPELFKPDRVTNFMGYNAGETPNFGSRYGNGAFWVPDLMLECRAELADPAATVTLDLAKGNRRFQAHFASGQVELRVVTPKGQVQTVAAAATPLTKAGGYDLRFSDFDARPRVWVNGRELTFGDNADLAPWADVAFDPTVDEYGFGDSNDLAPARIQATGGVTVSAVKLFQDTYYTTGSNQPSAVETLYVQPGHYLCLGDNSGFSLDSRYFGLVPERLMLGKALMIFAPLGRVGFIK